MEIWQQKMQDVREAVKRRGLNYTDFGKLIGVSRQRARNIMVGSACPSLRLWLILEKTFLEDPISKGVNSENENPKTSDPKNEKMLRCLTALKNQMDSIGEDENELYYDCVELIKELK